MFPRKLPPQDTVLPSELPITDRYEPGTDTRQLDPNIMGIYGTPRTPTGDVLLTQGNEPAAPDISIVASKKGKRDLLTQIDRPEGNEYIHSLPPRAAAKAAPRKVMRR